MSKDNKLIIDVIGASLKFDDIMDRIDFNSYLFEDQKNGKVKNTPLYKNYIEMIEKEAPNCCENIIQDIPPNITKIDVPNPKNQKEMEYYLIYHLLEAKKTRINARRQVKREDEVSEYIYSTHRLHKAFDCVLIENFCNLQKDKNLSQDYNWVKVLYYNELAICYSGLAKSSMSLGYAMESISLLEELYSELINLENPARDDEKDNFDKFINKVKDKKEILHPSDIIKHSLF